MLKISVQKRVTQTKHEPGESTFFLRLKTILFDLTTYHSFILGLRAFVKSITQSLDSVYLGQIRT